MSVGDAGRVMRGVPVCGPRSLALALIVLNVVAVGLALARYRPIFLQAGSLNFVFELAGVLVVYVVAILWVGTRDGDSWSLIRAKAGRYGLLTGLVEMIGIAVENYAPTGGPSVAAAFMLTTFVLWGWAGALVMRRTGEMRAGLLTSVASAGLCMLIAVAGGFVMELFVRPPLAGEVARWAEYLRSGWTDPRAFALANTLDSGFTHLLLAPFVAVVFGTVGCGFVRVFARLRPKLLGREQPE